VLLERNHCPPSMEGSPYLPRTALFHSSHSKEDCFAEPLKESALEKTTLWHLPIDFAFLFFLYIQVLFLGKM